jgi:hypothetical protein
MLERDSRHSEEGVMKAHWNREDFNAMFRRKLRFDVADVNMIRLSLSGRRVAR